MHHFSTLSNDGLKQSSWHVIATMSSSQNPIFINHRSTTGIAKTWSGINHILALKKESNSPGPTMWFDFDPIDDSIIRCACCKSLKFRKDKLFYWSFILPVGKLSFTDSKTDKSRLMFSVVVWIVVVVVVVVTKLILISAFSNYSNLCIQKI